MKAVLIYLGTALILISSCKNESTIELDRVLDMDIALQERVLQEGSENLLTIMVANTSDKKIRIPEGTFILEFTSYSGSIKKSYTLDFTGKSAPEKFGQALEIKGKEGFTQSINLQSILDQALTESESMLPVDEYTVNLILDVNSNSRNSKQSEKVRSNYLDLQVKG
jgi:hypothetical protein